MEDLTALQPDLTTEEQLIAGLIPTPGYPPEEQELHESLLQLQERIDLEKMQYYHKTVVMVLNSFREDVQGSGVITMDIFTDILRRQRMSPEDQVKTHEVYLRLQDVHISKGKFRYLLTRWQREQEEGTFVKILEDAYTVWKTGKKVGRTEVQGYRAARQFLEDGLFHLDQDTGQTLTPEGDIREQALEVVTEYHERKEAPESFVGIKSGLDVIDDLTNGAQPGELWIYGGYTEVGKSFMSINSAHHACTEQGKNVVLVSTEVVHNQYRRRMALRHARNTKFNLPHGIDADDYKRAKLTPEEEKSFQAAMQDLNENPNYGHMYLIQLPKGAGLSWVANKLNFLNAMWPVHALYLDSLNQLPNPRGGMDNQRSFFNQLVREAKQLAVNFDRGRGIPIFSPWHANRRSWEKALIDGKYTLASWQECDELERSADFLMWMLKLESEQDTREIQAGISKYRDGKKNQQFTLYQDFAASYLGSVAPTNIGQPVRNTTQPGSQKTASPVADTAAELF